ncbi:MAG: Histidinol-phosphate aminotransferase [Parabacteroides sp.]
MQVVILAAGMGKRLGTLTVNNTKCMVRVNGVTLIERLLSQLNHFDLTRIVIVIGYKGVELKAHLSQIKSTTIPIEYVYNDIYDKTNNIYSLSLAEEYLKEDDTILIESDLIFSDNLLSLIINDSHPNLALVAKYETWMDGTMVKIDDNNNILNFISKKEFNYKETDLYYKTVNIYKLSREFLLKHYLPFLDAYTKSLGNNEYYEQVLRVITFLDKCDLKALPIKDKWYEIDDIQDLDIAEAIFAEDDRKLELIQKRYGGYWRFPYLLDFCYLVNPYFPPQKMLDEIKANFTKLLTEYPSGLNINNLLASKSFNLNKDYVCVGNGAAELIKNLIPIIKGPLGMIYPTFEEYVNCSDNEIISFTPNNSDFSYTANELISFFDKKEITALLLINPDNPSGNFIPMSDLLSLIEWAKLRKIYIVIDESFVDFSVDGKYNTLLKNDLLVNNNHLIVVKSISKSFGVPGLRLGIIVTSNEFIISEIRKNVPIWNINSFAEFYLQIYSKYQVDYELACETFLKERDRFYEELIKIPFLRVIPSQANYFLCEVINYTSYELTKMLLLEYGIYIKNCSSKLGFKGLNYIRIAIRDQSDNKQLLWALNQLV